MRVFAFLLTLALVSPALAADWLQNCQASRTTTSVGPSGFVCFDPAANTDDSPILSVGQCSYTSWAYFQDKDGDATDCTVSFTIQKCPTGDLDATAADNGCEDVNITTPTLSSTNTGEGGVAVGSPFMRLKAGDAGDNAGDCRILVACSSGDL